MMKNIIFLSNLLFKTYINHTLSTYVYRLQFFFFSPPQYKIESNSY